MERWRFILGSVLVAALLYWLYPKSPQRTAGDVVEITVWFNGPIEGRQLDVIDAFERRFPQYRVILGSSAVRTGLEGEGNPQRLMCGIAGGVPPEVVEYDRFAICQWAARHAFMDLKPLIDGDLSRVGTAHPATAAVGTAGHDTDAEKHPPQPPLGGTGEEVGNAHPTHYLVRPDDYYPQTWNEASYQGGQYGIPNYMDDRVLYFNADLLTQAGLLDDQGNPKPPDTWEQILTKRIDVEDAAIAAEPNHDRARIRIETADFIAVGVAPGDSVSHISKQGIVQRCVVDQVIGPHEIIVKSPYPAARLALPTQSGQHIKIFDQHSYALRLTRWDDAGRIQIVGFEPQHGNAWLYLYGWANGGQFMSADSRTCTLNDPRIVEALQWTTDVYDALGGADQVNAFKKSFQSGAQDPFLLGQVAMFINGDWFLRDLARYKRDMRFGTHRPPVPRRMIGAGRRNTTWVAGFAYCIPATCPPEKLEAAWTLVKFLSSVEGGTIMNEHDAQRDRSQGRLYMPRLVANRRLNEAQIAGYVNIPEMPARMKAAIQTHIDMLAGGRFRPVSPAGQTLWNAQADAQDLAWNHTMTPHAALDYQAGRVQRVLDEFNRKPTGVTTVQWGWLVWAYLALLVAIGAAVWLRFRIKNRARGFYRHEWYAGLAFVAPWLLGFIVLSGGPMVFSAVMSLTRYDVINPAVYVGLDNYREMFTADWGGPDAEGKETVPTGVRHALMNTLFMAIGLPLGMIIGLGVAMLLNAKVRGMRGYRTLFFLPAIMPVVAASILWIWVFNAQNGLLNWLLQATGVEHVIRWTSATFDWFHIQTPISWLTNKQTSKPALIIMTLWGAGASMIIWLAGLKDIPTHLYEAASLDGAGPVRRFFRITLPMLSPYILFNLIIGLIGTFQIFTQAYIMTPNGYPERSTYFYVYKLFDECFSYFRLGYGAAMAWVLFAILVVLTVINMRLSKRWVFYAGD